MVHHAMNNCMTYIRVLKWLSNQHMTIKGTRRTKSHAINNLFFGTDHITVYLIHCPPKNGFGHKKGVYFFSLPLLGPRCGSWVAGSD